MRQLRSGLPLSRERRDEVIRTEDPRVLAGHSDHFCVLDYRAFLRATRRAQELAHKPLDLLNKLHYPCTRPVSRHFRKEDRHLVGVPRGPTQLDEIKNFHAEVRSGHVILC